MPKIVFWSPITRTTGNTHAAIAVSTFMGMTEDVSAILLHAHWQTKKIESSFTDYDQLKNMNIFSNSNIGITALSRLVESNKLVPESIKNYAKPVLKQKLDIMYGTNVTKRDQFAALTETFPAIVRKANDAYDFAIVDLPKGSENPYIREVIEDADLVICTINQDIVRLDEFFEEIENNPIIKDKNKIIVVGDYEYKSKCNLFNIKGRYKTKVPMFAVPHNYIFMDACNDGAAVDFFYKNAKAEANDYNGYFIKEVEKTEQLIDEIVIANRSQDEGTENIRSTVNNLSNAVQQNASFSEELSAMAEELSAQSQNLLDVMKFFDTENDSYKLKTLPKL